MVRVCFGLVVLITDAGIAPFMVFNPAVTIVFVLLRGIITGLAAGIVYRLVATKNKTAAVIAAAVISPIANTGIFILGMYIIFMPVVMGFAEFFGQETATGVIFIGFGIVLNFPLELGLNIVLISSIVRLIQFAQDRKLRTM